MSIVKKLRRHWMATKVQPIVELTKYIFKKTLLHCFTSICFIKSLSSVILLDKIQKRAPIPDDSAKAVTIILHTYRYMEIVKNNGNCMNMIIIMYRIECINFGMLSISIFNPALNRFLNKRVERRSVRFCKNGCSAMQIGR